MSYEQNRKKVIDKMTDQYGYLFCENCKRSAGFRNLHVHHIFFRSEVPNHPSLHHPLNLLIVCDECHNDFHSGNKHEKRAKIVEERKLNNLFK